MGSKPSQFHFTKPGPLRLYSVRELIAMPPPTWLIHGLLPTNGLAGMYGQPGSGKSFVAIDWAMCVAAGLPWQGRAVEKGTVLYVSAEGGSGIGKRMNAWVLEHGVKDSDVDLMGLIESIPINADSEQMEQLCTRIVEEVGRFPDFIVIDTLARCFDGDENLQEDMGRFIAGVDLLRVQFGAAVLVVHHTRLGAERERGSTAFRGAADTMIKVEKEKKSPYVDISCDKQKDAEEFDPIGLELVISPIAASCYLRGSNTEALRQVLLDEVLAPLLDGPMTWDNWLQATGKTRSEFMKAFQTLKSKHLVAKFGEVWKAKVPTTPEG